MPADKVLAKKKADEIFDYMEKFAGYGFNKSHAAAYAYVSYQTAWLKAHYPAEFMAATMSSELDNTDQLKVFYDDARSKLNGISFLPPDINESFYRFIPNQNKQIRYAWVRLKARAKQQSTRLWRNVNVLENLLACLILRTHGQAAH